MQKLRLISSIFLLSIGLAGLTACSPTQKTENEIRVGTISGPETQLMEVAKEVALKKYNLDVKIVEFSDYSLPNTALNDGNLDANMFQHEPYLEEEIKNKHYNITPIGKTFIYPMGIYSKKIKNLNQLKNNAIVAIPNDPTNEGRALLLLSKAGLIQLSAKASFLVTPRDITSNPKNLKFKELDAAQLTRALPDVDLAVINTNYAVLAGLYPNKNALFVEGKNSPYANLIVVRSDEVNNPKLKELVKALQSQEVKNSAKKIFDGQAIPAWK